MLFRREPIRAQIRRQAADTSLFTATHAAGWMNESNGIKSKSKSNKKTLLNT